MNAREWDKRQYENKKSKDVIVYCKECGSEHLFAKEELELKCCNHVLAYRLYKTAIVFSNGELET